MKTIPENDKVRRIVELLSLLTNGNTRRKKFVKLNCKTLSKQFGVSVRTIQRDIHDIKVVYRKSVDYNASLS